MDNSSTYRLFLVHSGFNIQSLTNSSASAWSFDLAVTATYVNTTFVKISAISATTTLRLQ